KFLRWFNDWFTRVTHRYESGVQFVMRRGALAAGVFVAMIIATIGLFLHVPNSLAPQEDQGYVFVIGALPDAASLDRTTKSIRTVETAIRDNPAVQTAVAIAGMDALTQAFKTNGGIVWLPLKDWEERHGDDAQTPEAVIGAVYGIASQVKDGMFFA